MNEDEKWEDFMFNLKFWIIVAVVGLVLHEVLK